MSWIINGVYISDNDCVSKQTSDKDNIKALHSTSICINWKE